jgi:anti-anti-sigma factor
VREHETVTEVPAAGTSDHPGDPSAGAAGDAASVHRLVHAPDGPSVFEVVVDEEAIALSGSVDTASAGRLARVLASSPVSGDCAVLDLGRVDFVDVAASRVIARWAQDLEARALPLEVRGASPLLQRMWSVLGFREIAPVTFTRSVAEPPLPASR